MQRLASRGLPRALATHLVPHPFPHAHSRHHHHAAAAAAAAAARECVDVDQFPLHEPHGAAFGACVAACRAQLAATGLACLPGFLRPHAVEAMLGEVRELEAKGEGYDSLDHHTVFLEDGDERLGATHPRNQQFKSSKTLLAADQVPSSSPLSLVYHWPPLAHFIRETLGIERVHLCEDELGKFYYNVFHHDDQLGWHFDRSPFSINLILQTSQGGGRFQFLPNSRDEVAALSELPPTPELEGRAVVPDLQPGTLVLFRGSHALHRVSPVEGAVPRVNAICTFSESPGLRLNDYTLLKFFGRTG